MSSKGHDFILEMIQIRMRQMGYNLLSSESHYRDIKYKIPPTVISHRPDAIGYNSNTNSICVGEAKYYGDLNSDRSQTQIKDFIGLANDRKRDINIIFGIPLSQEIHFQKILRKNDLELNQKIIILKIPDRLIPQEKENEET
jgi:hypothetical protein